EYATAINIHLVCVGRQHQVDFRLYLLIAKDVNIDWLGSTEGYYLFIPSKRDRSGWANTRAHRFQSFRRSVVTHVALHLQMHLGVVFRNSEWTRINAVAAIETAWLQR